MIWNTSGFKRSRGTDLDSIYSIVGGLWAKRAIALTANEICFAKTGEDSVLDRVPILEVDLTTCLSTVQSHDVCIIRS